MFSDAEYSSISSIIDIHNFCDMKGIMKAGHLVIAALESELLHVLTHVEDLREKGVNRVGDDRLIVVIPNNGRYNRSERPGTIQEIICPTHRPQTSP